MIFASARYTDASRSAVCVVMDGAEVVVPASEGNRHYRALLAAGVVIDEADTPDTTLDMIRDEAERRIMLVLGSRDAAHMAQEIQEMQSEAIALMRKQLRGETLTADEAVRATALDLIDASMRAIRQAEAALGFVKPADYRADKYWPEGSGQ